MIENNQHIENITVILVRGFSTPTGAALLNCRGAEPPKSIFKTSSTKNKDEKRSVDPVSSVIPPPVFSTIGRSFSLD